MTSPRFRRRNVIRNKEGEQHLDAGVTVPAKFSAVITWYDDNDDVPFDLVVNVEHFDGLPRIVGANFRSATGLPLNLLKQEWDWGWLLEHVMSNAAKYDPGRTARGSKTISMVVRRANDAMSKSDRYERVAKIYSAYPGKDVVKHVAAKMPTSYGTARRWIEEARKTVNPSTGRTYLPAATNGRRTPAVQS